MPQNHKITKNHKILISSLIKICGILSLPVRQTGFSVFVAKKTFLIRLKNQILMLSIKNQFK